MPRVLAWPSLADDIDAGGWGEFKQWVGGGHIDLEVVKPNLRCLTELVAQLHHLQIFFAQPHVNHFKVAVGIFGFELDPVQTFTMTQVLVGQTLFRARLVG